MAAGHHEVAGERRLGGAHRPDVQIVNAFHSGQSFEIGTDGVRVDAVRNSAKRKVDGVAQEAPGAPDDHRRDCQACFAQRKRKVTIDMRMRDYHIAVAGATGAAGTELLRVLERRNFPVANLRPLASARSAGKSVQFRGESVPMEKLADRSFDRIDIAFFCTDGDLSKKYVPIACQANAIAIDKSSAFRMEPHVPLVIPEINADDVRRHRGLIANPNCTTTVMLMALYPLHRIFHVRRVFAASYQAVSGSGTRGVEELTRQVKDAARDLESFEQSASSAFANTKADTPTAATVFPHPIAFNLLPHVDSFLESGYTKEEAKMQD